MKREVEIRCAKCFKKFKTFKQAMKCNFQHSNGGNKWQTHI